MSLGVALDVAIGLVFTYLLLSLLASAVQEYWAGIWKSRGRGLRDSIAEMLDGRSGTLFQNVFGHSLVAGLSPKELPSYVPARNFSLALFDALGDGSQAPIFSQIEKKIAALPNGDAKQSLTALLKQAGGDVDSLRNGIEKWFDDAMDRASGIYKRYTHLFAFILGLVVTVGFNVDSIYIAKTLWTSSDARAAIVAKAQQFVSSNSDAGATKQQVDYARCALNQLPVPIGWVAAPRANSAPDKDPCASGGTAEQGSDQLSFSQIWAAFSATFKERGLWLLVGWLITACAVSLGAPFWFEMLKNLINVRAAGPKPPRADAAANSP